MYACVICCWLEPQKHSQFIVAWKFIVTKNNTFSSCSSSEKVLLELKMIQFCCLSNKALEKKQRGAPPGLLSVGKALIIKTVTTEDIFTNMIESVSGDAQIM